MLKKLVLAGVVAAVAVVAVKGTRFFGYAKQEVKSLATWADSQVPVEKKIEQMRGEVATLDRDIDQVATGLATEIVAVRNLTTQTDAKRTALAAEQKALLARGEGLKDTPERVKFGGEFISAGEAKDRLKRDVDLHLTRKRELASLEKSLSHRERTKETLEKQLHGLKKQKEELKVEIDAIEADYKALQLQQIESKYQTDDTRLSRIKAQLQDMKTKLEVEKTKLELTPVVREEGQPADPHQSVDAILAPLSEKGDKIAESK